MNNTTQESDRSKKNLILIVVTTFFSIVYLIWRTVYTIPFEYGAISVFAGISLLIASILLVMTSSRRELSYLLLM